MRKPEFPIHPVSALICKSILGSLTSCEEEELSKWLKEDESNLVLFDELTALNNIHNVIVSGCN